MKNARGDTKNKIKNLKKKTKQKKTDENVTIYSGVKYGNRINLTEKPNG